MRVLRLLLAGLIALAAVVASLFVAILVLVGGLAAYLLHFFRSPAGPTPSGPAATSRRPSSLRTDDAIEVVTTDVRSDQPARSPSKTPVK